MKINEPVASSGEILSGRSMRRSKSVASRPRMYKLALKDKPLFERFLRAGPPGLSTYSFANIFIWRSLFEIRWFIAADALCVLFGDKSGWFAYLAPRGGDSALAGEEIFRVLKRLNKNPDLSRIENAQEEDLSAFPPGGYEHKLKGCEYLCLRSEMASLTGDKFKSKRASCNYFVKHHRFEVAAYRKEQQAGCLKLYDQWSALRAQAFPDRIYALMMQDSRKALVQALENYSALGLKGLTVKAGGELKGFTLGFQLDEENFCVLYEITDLSAKGLAQFIFREFCRALEGYRLINIMDDSGLENLRKVKLSYHPVKLIPSYIVHKVGHV